MNNAMTLPDAMLRVQAALDRFERGWEVRQFPSSTRTAAEAAASIGCSLGQIAKSLVFSGKESQRLYLLVVSGDHRVDLALARGELGEKLQKADAEAVRRATGFAIGGVPPVGLATSLPTLLDENLLRYDQVWAAAGTPNSVFALPPQELPVLTGGRFAAFTIAGGGPSPGIKGC